MYHSLQVKIASRSLRVAVIGLGYVGLPLATVFAETGFQVIGICVPTPLSKTRDPDISHIVAATQ